VQERAKTCKISDYPHGDSNPGLLAENQKEQQRNSLSHLTDTQSQSSGCTTGCTRNSEISNPLTLEDLAAMLVNLLPEDRARLAAMLLREQGERCSDGQKAGSGHPDATSTR
jgi:hypothetical protein